MGFFNGLVSFKAFFPVGKTDKCLLSLIIMGSWKSSVLVSYTVLMGKAKLYSWLDNSAVSKRYHGDHLCNITTLFTTAQFKIQVEYFHDYGRVIISLLKGRRFRR